MQKQFNLTNHEILSTNVLIEPLEVEDDIVVSGSQYEDKASWGKVIKAGLDVKHVEEGDIVTFNEYAPIKFRVNGKDFLIVTEEEIISRY